MKCTCSRADLNDALNAVARAAAVKSTTPILSGIYMRAADNALELQATNFAIAIKATVPANIEAEGAAVVTAKVLTAIVAKLGGEIVTLSNENDAAALTLKSEAASFDLLAMDAADFPRIRPEEPAQSFRIHRDALKNLIASTVFACSRDDSRPVFTGCLFDLKGASVTVVATNTSRIAIAKDRLLDDTAPLQFIVHAATLKNLAALLSLSADPAVTVDFSTAGVAFSFDQFYFASRLIDGSFPAYQKVVPESTPTTAAVDRADLARALDRMLIVAAHSDYQSVRFAFSADSLQISSSSPDVGTSIEHLDAVVGGEPIELTFNIAFLADALRVFHSATVVFGLSQPLAPVLIHDAADSDAFLYVITPLRSND